MNLRSGTVFRGVLYRRAGEFWVLRQVEMLSDRDSKMEASAVHGEVLIKSADVDFMQLVAAGGGTS